MIFVQNFACPEINFGCPEIENPQSPVLCTQFQITGTPAAQRKNLVYFPLTNSKTVLHPQELCTPTLMATLDTFSKCSANAKRNVKHKTFGLHWTVSQVYFA